MLHVVDIECSGLRDVDLNWEVETLYHVWEFLLVGSIIITMSMQFLMMNINGITCIFYD